MPKSFPAEFRRRVLALVDEGRPVAEVAAELEIAAASIYRWRQQAQIDAGEKPGLSSVQSAELVAARKRIRELESEVAILRRATKELRDVVHPKGSTR
jgi:transposase-like protein